MTAVSAPAESSPTTPAVSTSRNLKIAVLSDLHCFSANDPARTAAPSEPSFFRADRTAATLTSDPLADLQQLISEKGLRADLVLCPGDLGDKGSAVGISHSWKWIVKTQDALHASRLVATVGNHDLDFSDTEPASHLKVLDPMFPIQDAGLKNEFWADHFTTLETAEYRLIVLNSSAHHAAGSKENQFGRIGRRQLAQLRIALQKSTRKPIQILLCHHHPHMHADFESNEDDVIKSGQQLLDELARHGNWLVVHGHKHHPKLTHAAGASNAPWVFAAGSVSAIQWSALSGHSRNQFYIITMDPDSFPNIGWGGRIKAWDWATGGDGWIEAGPSSGLPSDFGFGFLGNLEKVAADIKSALYAPNTYIDWDTVMSSYPYLVRLSPTDIKELLNLGLSIEFGSNGVPLQISRK